MNVLGKLPYPTSERGKESSKVPFKGDMLVPRRVDDTSFQGFARLQQTSYWEGNAIYFDPGYLRLKSLMSWWRENGIQ